MSTVLWTVLGGVFAGYVLCLTYRVYREHQRMERKRREIRDRLRRYARENAERNPW